jgi:hypothetical protein
MAVSVSNDVRNIEVRRVLEGADVQIDELAAFVLHIDLMCSDRVKYEESEAERSVSSVSEIRASRYVIFDFLQNDEVLRVAADGFSAVLPKSASGMHSASQPAAQPF